MRVLIADPESLALKMSDLRSEDPNHSDYYRQKLDATLQDIDYLYRYQERIGADFKGKFEVRLLQYAPSFGIFSFNAHLPNAVTIVELYPHVAGWGSEACFDLIPRRDGAWYDYFVEQFEQMWKGAKPWQPEKERAKAS